MLKENYGRMVEAVRQRAAALCPDSLELIGVYGSCATGDTHEKSDLDLLILIRDEAGRCLAEGFILEDCGIGFDFYCTTWAMLEGDAACEHPHLGKLMDAKILWVRDPEVTMRLEELRTKAALALASEERFSKAEAAFGRGKAAMAECFLAESLACARYHAAGVICEGLNAVMLSHGVYFRRGVKRATEEVARVAPDWDARRSALAVAEAPDTDALREAVTGFLREARDHMDKPAPTEREAPCRENLAGTYEEMVSNWRNKMTEAAERGDAFSSFVNLASLEGMLREVSEGVDIPCPTVLEGYDPRDLRGNAEVFDNALEEFLGTYRRAGISPRRYADAEAFLRAYLDGL